MNCPQYVADGSNMGVVTDAFNCNGGCWRFERTNKVITATGDACSGTGVPDDGKHMRLRVIGSLESTLGGHAKLSRGGKLRCSGSQEGVVTKVINRRRGFVADTKVDGVEKCADLVGMQRVKACQKVRNGVGRHEGGTKGATGEARRA